MSGFYSRNVRYPRYQDTDFLQLCPPVPPPVLPDPDPTLSQQSQSGPALSPTTLANTPDPQLFVQSQNNLKNEALDVSSDAVSSDFAFSDPEDIDLTNKPLN